MTCLGIVELLRKPDHTLARGGSRVPIPQPHRQDRGLVAARQRVRQAPVLPGVVPLDLRRDEPDRTPPGRRDVAGERGLAHQRCHDDGLLLQGAGRRPSPERWHVHLTPYSPPRREQRAVPTRRGGAPASLSCGRLSCFKTKNTPVTFDGRAFGDPSGTRLEPIGRG